MMASRNSRYDRDDVADAALALLDRLGLPDLSMRRLASELDVQPSALYWHFANKQELLGAVADRIVARIPRVTTKGTWESQLVQRASAIRDALLAYRDGAELVISTAALQTGASGPQTLLDDLLAAHIPEVDERRHAAAAIVQFILGHTTLVQQRMHAESHGALTETGADLLADSHVTFEAAIRLFSAGIVATGSASTTARRVESNPSGTRE